MLAALSGSVIVCLRSVVEDTAVYEHYMSLVLLFLMGMTGGRALRDQIVASRVSRSPGIAEVRKTVVSPAHGLILFVLVVVGTAAVLWLATITRLMGWLGDHLTYQRWMNRIVLVLSLAVVTFAESSRRNLMRRSGRPRFSDAQRRIRKLAWALIVAAFVITLL